MLATIGHSFSQSWNSGISKWTCNTFCPQANHQILLHFASQFSSRRKCLWPGYAFLGTGAILCLQTGECVLVHFAAAGCRPDQNPSEINRKDILWLRWTLAQGCNRIVFEPQVLFVFSVLKLLVVFTLQEKNVSKKQGVSPRACTGEQRSPSFAKLSLNLKLLETVHRGRERIKIQTKQHISGFVWERDAVKMTC